MAAAVGRLLLESAGSVATRRLPKTVHVSEASARP